MIPDLTEALLCARLSSAAYLMTNDAVGGAIQPLGCQLLARIVTEDRVCFLAERDHQIYRVWQGTRVEEDTSLAEIWCDLDMTMVELPGGVRAPRGFIDPVLRVLTAADQVITDPMVPIIDIGHSLGGVSANEAYVVRKLQGRLGRAISFGAPKGGDAAFWGQADATEVTRFVREHDFASEWPWRHHLLPPWDHDSAVQPAPMVFLHGGQVELTATRPGLVQLSVRDHSDARYVSDLVALTSAPAPAAA